MDFKKKIRIRLRRSIAYTIFGAALIAVGFITKSDDFFLSSFGFAFMVVGILQTVKNAAIMKNDNILKQYEIAETDERNIMIAHRARSMTFSITLCIIGIAIIILSVIGMHKIAAYLGYAVCVEVLINLICYQVMKKKY